MDKSEAEAILRPYLKSVKDCIVSGWEEYIEFYHNKKTKHEIRTVANIIRDLIVYNARREFDNNKKTKIVENNNLFLLEIEEKFFIRFKKLDELMRSSNFPTVQAKSYACQIPFPWMEQQMRLHLNAGYVPNQFWSEIQGVHIVCPRDDQEVLWIIDLSEVDLPMIDYRPDSLNKKKNSEKKRAWPRNNKDGKGRKENASRSKS